MEVKVDPKSTRVQRINSLVAIAFGKGFSANWQHTEEGSFQTKRKIGIIAKTSFFNRWITYYGRFTNDDPTQLRMVPEYLSQAERYAKAYEKMYGGSVKITVTEESILEDIRNG